MSPVAQVRSGVATTGEVLESPFTPEKRDGVAVAPARARASDLPLRCAVACAACLTLFAEEFAAGRLMFSSQARNYIQGMKNLNNVEIRSMMACIPWKHGFSGLACSEL